MEQLDERVIIMVAIVLLAFWGMWRIYKSIRISEDVEKLKVPLENCTTPDTCGKNRVCQFLLDLKTIFQPLKQFIFSSATLFGTLFIVLLTLLFPPDDSWQKVSSLLRGFAMGSQVVVSVVITYLAKRLEKAVCA